MNGWEVFFKALRDQSIATAEQIKEARLRTEKGGSLVTHLVSVGSEGPKVISCLSSLAKVPLASEEQIAAAHLPDDLLPHADVLQRLAIAPLGARGGKALLGFSDISVMQNWAAYGLPPHTPLLILEQDAKRALELALGKASSGDTLLAPLVRAQNQSVASPFDEPSLRVQPLAPSETTQPFESHEISGPLIAAPMPPPTSLAANPAKAASPLGEHLDQTLDYVSPLGKGGMAEVLLAKRKAGGDLVAVKLMKSELAEEEEYVTRFTREANAMQSIAHDNVMRVFDSGFDGKNHYMVSEFLDGGTVGELMEREGVLPALLASIIIDDVLAGLEAAHEKGITHRDVKPANLLLAKRDGKVRVADFGIAKVQGDSKLTMTGQVIGTPAYMAPEQVRLGQADHRSDIFACGVVLYQMLSGINPFLAETPQATAIRVSRGVYPPIFEVAPGVPALLERAIEEMLVDDPDKRIQNIASVRALIKPILDDANQHHLGVDATSKRAMSEPKVLIEELKKEQSRRELDRARAAMGDLGTQARAALAAYRSVCIDPDNLESKEILNRLSLSQKLNFGKTNNPTLLNLEKEVSADPTNPGLLKRTADLYRAEGNLFLFVCYLKRYLKIKSTDSLSRQQLQALLGDKPDTPFASGDTSQIELVRDPYAKRTLPKLNDVGRPSVIAAPQPFVQNIATHRVPSPMLKRGAVGTSIEANTAEGVVLGLLGVLKRYALWIIVVFVIAFGIIGIGSFLKNTQDDMNAKQDALLKKKQEDENLRMREDIRLKKEEIKRRNKRLNR